MRQAAHQTIGSILGLQPRDKAAMLVVNRKNCFRRISTKIELSSSRREMLLSLTTNMAAVTSRANQYPGYILLFITASNSLLMKI